MKDLVGIPNAKGANSTLPVSRQRRDIQIARRTCADSEDSALAIKVLPVPPHGLTLSTPTNASAEMVGHHRSKGSPWCSAGKNAVKIQPDRLAATFRIYHAEAGTHLAWKRGFRLAPIAAFQRD